MTTLFRTPPGWPAPPDGFIPGESWSPDPIWGPAPIDWVFYTENGRPAYPPRGSWQPTLTGPSSAPVPLAASPAPRPAAQRSPVAVAAIVLLSVVLISGLVLGGLWLSGAFAPTGPTFTEAQFATVFDSGDPLLGEPISARYSGLPDGQAPSGPCGAAVYNLPYTAPDMLLAKSADGMSSVVWGGRHTRPETARDLFTAAAAACHVHTTKTVNGAKWFSTSVDGYAFVILQWGNVGISATRYVDRAVAGETYAAAIQKELADAARR